jgi:hypothetical protein
MKIAVMSLTRDRLAYTQHCFGKLRELAGCDFHHYVLDQGSTDGTVEWLDGYTLATSVCLPENIGCCAGWNYLLDQVFDPADYDVVVCFDNDCELMQPDTLRVVASLAAEHDAILSPRVLGLNNPPPTIGEIPLGDHAADETTILGNIFMAIPAPLLELFDWDERHQPWDGGETITAWHRARGGRCGYVRGYSVNHYETTNGQHQRYPEYFARTLAEGKPAL